MTNDALTHESGPNPFGAYMESKVDMTAAGVGVGAVPPSEWVWFGDAGHFICGRWCRFHLTTQVGGFLVSTVGRYVHPRQSGGSEQAEAVWLAKNPDGESIGCDRFYETMVFRAGKPCSARQCGCGLPEISGSELDFEGYQTAAAAAKGHAAMCARWADPSTEAGSTPTVEGGEK